MIGQTFLGATSTSIGKFLGTLLGNVQNYVFIIIMIVGIVMVCAGVIQVAKNLISHGKTQTNWIVTIALIVIGGILMMTGGFKVISDFTKDSQTTLENTLNGDADNDFGDPTSPEGLK